MEKSRSNRMCSEGGARTVTAQYRTTLPRLSFRGRGAE